METDDEEERQLRTAALKNAESILLARRRAQEELRAAKEALERKNEELLQQREWFEVTLSSIGDAVITTDLQCNVTFLNPVAEAMTGWTLDEARGKPLTTVFHVIDEQTLLPIENPVHRVLQENRVVGLANHAALVRRDGNSIAIEDSAAPIRDLKGDLAGAVMVFHDVAERRRSDAAMREETRVLEILNRTGTAIAGELDLGLLVQTVTDAATQISGAKFGAFFYNVIDAAGESFLLFSLSGAPREAFEKFGLPRNTPVFNHTFIGIGPVRSADITQDPRYGQMAPHHGMPKGHLPVRSYLAVPVVARSGEVLGGLFFGHPERDVFTERAERLVLGVASQAAIAIDNARLFDAAQREIASRERAEAALREADRRKDEFLATLAHELRNPLAPIRQAAQISRSSGASDEQKSLSHDVIGRQVLHMSMLLDDLLDISRITRGTLQLRPVACDLATVIDSAVETARPLIDAKGHLFRSEVPAEACTLMADPLRLAQVFANLLTNAAKYTDPGGHISLPAECTEDSVTVYVSDTGIGIPPEAQAQVFEMFAQVQSSQDRSDGGLGIGLALTKGLVEMHGGRIEVSSAGLAAGSEFTVHLPRPAIQRSASPVPNRQPVRGNRSQRILIADDNRDAAETLKMILQIEGHDVLVAHDGEAAVAAFASFRPEVAVLDIGMPKLNGYDVARRLRQSSSDRALTLVAVTGWGQDSDKLRAQEAGFDHHFTKPMDPDELIALLPSMHA